MKVVLISCLVNNKFFSIIVSINFQEETKKIENFEDLAYSELPIYTSERFKSTHFDLEEEVFKKLTEKIKYDPDCIDKLVNTRNNICIVGYMDADFALYKYRNPDGSPIMYKAAEYNCEDGFYVFEPSSPYVNLFQAFVRRVYASGIIKHAINLYFGFMNPFADIIVIKEQQEDTDDIFNCLLSILSVGYLSASVGFFAEIVIGCNEKIRNFILSAYG